MIVLQWMHFAERSTLQQRTCLHWKRKRCSLRSWPFASCCLHSRPSGYL